MEVASKHAECEHVFFCLVGKRGRIYLGCTRVARCGMRCCVLVVFTPIIELSRYIRLSCLDAL